MTFETITSNQGYAQRTSLAGEEKTRTERLWEDLLNTPTGQQLKNLLPQIHKIRYLYDANKQPMLELQSFNGQKVVVPNERIDPRASRIIQNILGSPEPLPKRPEKPKPEAPPAPKEEPLVEAQRKIAALESRVEELTEQYDASEKARAKALRKIERLSTQLERMEEDFSGEQTRMEQEHKQGLREVRRDMRRQLREHAQAQHQLTLQSDSLAQQLRTSQARIVRLQQAASADRQQSAQENGQLQRQIRDLEQASVRLQREFQDLDLSKELLKTDLEHTIEELRKQIATFEETSGTQVYQLRRELRALSRAHEEQTRELDTLYSISEDRGQELERLKERFRRELGRAAQQQDEITRQMRLLDHYQGEARQLREASFAQEQLSTRTIGELRQRIIRETDTHQEALGEAQSEIRLLRQRLRDRASSDEERPYSETSSQIEDLLVRMETTQREIAALLDGPETDELAAIIRASQEQTERLSALVRQHIGSQSPSPAASSQGSEGKSDDD